MSRHIAKLLAILPLAAPWAACSEGLAPQLRAAPVTLLVTSGTCASGVCDTLHVLAFPARQPHTPGGLWSLDVGTVTAPTACLTLPDSAGSLIPGPSNAQPLAWTPRDSVSLGVLMPGANRLTAAPSTRDFVPASAQGWSVTLPGDTVVHPGQACG